MIDLPPSQKQVYNCIAWYINVHSRAPTLRELAIALDLSKSTIYIHLQKLIKKGYVVQQYRVERGLILLKQE